ncbi:TPR-like protein [Terfezia boudieri ATCC MYA-4762]|uniref:protein O-GlcNAc transferase n=1 Tax=Terfezia boudieri ATCC MYA-4762 TaxID=1051890 RepID=A0A3N4LLV9_9PEZI|nr:TPR-like protein [Terfezia boudieri ATCC MYA-4762]
MSNARVTPSLGTNGFGQIIGGTGGLVNPAAAKIAAYHALDTLQQLCAESGWRWLDGMLLGGCIAYALSDLNRALGWYLKIIEVDPLHVEALSNLGATLLALGRRTEAEEYWLRAVKARPNYFEAVEHLVGLLCGEQRGRDAVALIEFVERSVKRRSALQLDGCDMSVCSSSSECSRASVSQTSSPEIKFDYYEDDEAPTTPIPPLSGQPEYVISGADNGRLLGLIHAKGNMLYTLGDNTGAAKAFEDAVLIGAGREKHGIKGLIQRILDMLASVTDGLRLGERAIQSVLLTPEKALKTAQLVFPPNGELPGLRELPSGSAMRIAISTTSNSLLSLAKIFQDGMSSSAGGSGLVSAGVKDILALYYLSLSLHPSPSTANNVGILLASVQQTSPVSSISEASFLPAYTLGSGVGLALLYYQYGLMLDPRHAHLYTNLGSLLKDINNLPMAIRMYEQAVLCDGTFDIALANLANAVKDQGRTKEAIKYYRRAVAVSPNFAEAVCGLANALNSVCDWKGRGGVVKSGGALDRWHVNDDGSLFDAKATGAVSRGWMGRVVSIVEKQLEEGEHWGKGILIGNVLDTLLREVETAVGGEWPQERREALRQMVVGWAGKKNEGAKVVRLIERAVRRAGWRWYREKYIRQVQRPLESYLRPTLPACLSIPSAPTVLPFHTFTCPLSAKQVRMISQRNGARISCSTMRAPWLSAHIYPPPAPPSPHLNVGYISSDFNNHPLAHLMQSVFGMHDPSRVKAHCYATTPSDNSPHRLQIEREAPRFYDTSCWGPDRLINQIIKDGIHILVNLNGFTRGAKNEIFAARPAPIQMSFMGFAGSLGADWCDYLLADDTAVPPDTVRPWRRNVDLEDGGHEDGDDGDWVYCENIVFTKYSFFCCDHRQSAPDAKGPRLSWDAELQRRWKMRKELFPDLPDDSVILGNFNQLYKIEPTTFRTWLRIIAKVPNARLWLLRFPDLGEKNLRELAEKWAGVEVARRIIFTDVAPKQQHIARARVCDIFLDTPECNAHTTAADVTWSGTPLLTLPRHKYKMCSRIAASIVRAAVPPTTEGKRISDKLIAESEEDYERRAVNLASGLKYERGSNGIAIGELIDIRKVLFEGRWTSPLFDTKRWVQDLETAYELAWKRWVDGEGGDIRLQ